MKKVYVMMLLAMASVMGAKAEPSAKERTDAEEYIIDLGIRNYGGKYLGLTDTYRENDKLVVREYEVWAYPTKVGTDSVKLFQVGDKSYQLGVLNGGTVTPAEGFKFATYSEENSAGGNEFYWKMDSLERLYRFGVGEVYIFVVPGYKDSVKQAVAKRYDTEVNRAMFDYYFKMKLEPILIQCGVTMCSNFEKDTTYRYAVSAGNTSGYPYFMMDSASLGFLAYGLGQAVEFLWQYHNADPWTTRVWTDYNGPFTATAEQMTQGFSYTLPLQFTEGGYRNQYWHLKYRPVGTTTWSETKELGFFPSYPFELIGPIAIGSGYSKRNVEAGERDTIWKYYGGTEAFTGSEDAPCNNLIVATPACKIDTLKSGLLQATQNGSWITISANLRETVKLTFLNKDTSVYAVETIPCGESKLPKAPEGQEVDQLVGEFAPGLNTFTKDQFLEESFTEDKRFFISFKLLSGLKELMATLPADTKAFNILGQEVKDDYKGVVVIGGKKYIIK